MFSLNSNLLSSNPIGHSTITRSSTPSKRIQKYFDSDSEKKLVQNSQEVEHKAVRAATKSDK